jgi:hypothetical protein
LNQDEATRQGEPENVTRHVLRQEGLRVKDARESAAGMRQEPLDKPNLLARLIEMIESALDMAVCAREMVRDGAVC